MVVIPLGMTKEVRPVHFLKAPPPIDCRPSGRVMEVSPVHSSKALPPIDCRPSGRVMEVRPLHSRKALSPIDCRLSGSSTEVMLLQPRMMFAGRWRTWLPMSMVDRLSQPAIHWESSSQLSESKWMVVSSLHPSKAFFAILRVVAGTVTVARLRQLLKALSPTFLGTVMSVSLEQPANTPVPI